MFATLHYWVSADMTRNIFAATLPSHNNNTVQDTSLDWQRRGLCTVQVSRVSDSSRLCPLEEYFTVISKELGIGGECPAVLGDELRGKFHLGQVLGAQV